MSHNAPQIGSMKQDKAADAHCLRSRGVAPFAMRLMPDYHYQPPLSAAVNWGFSCELLACFHLSF
jgi:hypothetical protein